MPIKATPYQHQIDAFNFVCEKFGLLDDNLASSGSALLMEMGTEKTITTISIIGALYQAGKIKRALIVAPLSIVGVWEQELQKFADFDYNAVTFRGKYKGVANVEPSKKKSVPIVLWEITEDCETALDLYEGFPTFYIKKQVDILVDEKHTKIMIYVMTEEYTSLAAKPTDYYYNVIARGYYDNGLDYEPLQIAYAECLKGLG